MARKSRTFTATFYGATRIGCSTNGNPTWSLRTSEGTYRTQSDASLGYAIGNHTGGPNSLIDHEVTFTATPAGRVYDMKAV